MRSLLLTSLLISAALCLPSSSRPACNDNHHFICNTGACIPLEWMCDNVPDCPGKDDEASCNLDHTCLADQFKCKNDDCIPKDKKCDGHSDCLDESDEIGCEEMKTLTFPLSSTVVAAVAAASLCDDDHHFTCKNGSCIPMEWMCDNRPDCLEAEDETQCENLHTCSAEEFKCQNDLCVPWTAKCNGHQECSDGSDEFGCTGAFSPSPISTTPASSSSATDISEASAVNDASVSYGTYILYIILLVAVIGLSAVAYKYIRRRRVQHEGAVKFNSLENAVYNDEQS